MKRVLKKWKKAERKARNKPKAKEAEPVRIFTPNIKRRPKWAMEAQQRNPGLGTLSYLPPEVRQLIWKAPLEINAVKSTSSCCPLLVSRGLYEIATAALTVGDEWRAIPNDFGRWMDKYVHLPLVPSPRLFIPYKHLIHVFSWAQKWKYCERRRRALPALQDEIDQTFLRAYCAGFESTQSIEDFMRILEPHMSRNIAHMRLKLGRQPYRKWRLKEAKFWREFFNHPPLPNLRSVSLEFNHEHGCRSHELNDRHRTRATTDDELEMVQAQRKTGVKQDLALLEILCMIAARNEIIVTMADSNNGCEWCSDACQAIVASVEK